jgi:hypothetical protein
MATIIREVLNNATQSLTIFCGGMAKVGIGIPALSGAGTTVSFFGSTDGLNFIPINVNIFPFSAGQSTTTATGNFETPVLDFVAMRVQVTTLGPAGAVTVVMAVAIDSSWQDAYLTPQQKWPSSYKLGGGQNILNIPAQANRAWRLRTLLISAVGGLTGWASQPVVQIVDGPFPVLPNTNTWVFDLLPANQSMTDVPLPADSNTPGVSGGGIVGTPGNQMNIVLASPSAASSGSSGAGGALALATSICAEIIAA